MKRIDLAPRHPVFSRRLALQAGSVGILGLGMNHLEALRAAEGDEPPRAKAVIYIFLSGGLAQHDSFDLKPHAPDNVRGEFKPIATETPGVQICEHLPELAKRSHLWSVVRSLTHPYNEHVEGHMVMLSGRTPLPTGFDRQGGSQERNWPSIASVAGAAKEPRNNLPPAVVLPESLRSSPSQAVPGQLAGLMGRRHDPWIIDASPYRAHRWGAYPDYAFDHHTEKLIEDDSSFEAPSLNLPEGIGPGRLSGRTGLLRELERQRRRLDGVARVSDLDRFRQGAISLLADPKLQWAFDVTRAAPKTQDRYGRNSFGWSLLMARRLVEAGVSLVQVNLGNQSTWDTHGSNFIKLRDFLLPPTDQALSALLDDLSASGLLESTMIVMAGEFGRSPKIFQCCPKIYDRPGRDHWGAVQSVLFAGGGVRGGTVIGASDKLGAYPASQPQKPENMAATIYQALGIPPSAVWNDELDRPHRIYHGDPIPGLT